MEQTTLPNNGHQALIERPPVDQLTAANVDVQAFYELTDLDHMSVDALTELEGAIPAQDKKFYDQVFNRGLRETFGDRPLSDAERLQLLKYWLYVYETEQQIPTRHGWVQASDRLMETLRRGEELQPVFEAQKKQKTDPKLLAAAAGAALIFFCLAMAFIRNLSNGKSQVVSEHATATAAYVLSLTPSRGVQATVTPTPLALENTDRIIKSGDFKEYYPTTIEFPRGDSSRVFVVQQKAVETSDWLFPDDPDTASWVEGLVVRPPIGIPYSPENADLLNNLSANDAILLRMSTGNILTFHVTGKSRVPRQDTSIFRQITPGVVVVLLGEPNVSDRLVVTGEYPTDQELTRFASLLPSDQAGGQSADVNQPIQFENGMNVAASQAYTSVGAPGAELPPTHTYYLVDLIFQTGSVPVSLASLRVELADMAGQSYAPVTLPDTSISNNQLLGNQQLEANTRYALTAAFLIPRSTSGTTTLTLQIPNGMPVQYRLPYTPPTNVAVTDLDVMVLRISTTHSQTWPVQPEHLLADVRIFNPNTSMITIRSADVYAIFSPVVPDGADRPSGNLTMPIGPIQGPTDPIFPIQLQPNQALDLQIIWAWDGSPYVGLNFLGYQYVALVEH